MNGQFLNGAWKEQYDRAIDLTAEEQLELLSALLYWKRFDDDFINGVKNFLDNRMKK